MNRQATHTYQWITAPSTPNCVAVVAVALTLMTVLLVNVTKAISSMLTVIYVKVKLYSCVLYPIKVTDIFLEYKVRD